MTSAKRQPKVNDPIPEFKNREEEAEFWRTHDVADYWDEFKPVKVQVGKDLSVGITVRFDGQTLAELRRRAKEIGIGPTTLVRLWVLERLRQEAKRS